MNVVLLLGKSHLFSYLPVSFTPDVQRILFFFCFTGIKRINVIVRRFAKLMSRVLALCQSESSFFYLKKKKHISPKGNYYFSTQNCQCARIGVKFLLNFFWLITSEILMKA